MTSMSEPACPRAGIPFSLWLLPRAEDMPGWQALIDALAARFASPAFVPHVTLGVGTLAPERPMNTATRQALQNVASEVARQWHPLSLPVQAISTGTSRFQCVMIDLPGAPVQRLASAIAERFNTGNEGLTSDSLQISLHTHLSLIYATLPAPERQALAGSLTPVQATIGFDRIALVLPGPGRMHFDDPSEWLMLEPIPLAGPARGIG